jgi:hypothetical protein
MDKRVLKFAAAIEAMTSFGLYALAPTDSVRVWYPSVWAYVGEHGLVWVIAFAGVFFVATGVFKNPVRPDVLTLLTCIVAELVSTAYVWFVIPANSGGDSRAWCTSRFIDYLGTRSTVWCVIAILAVPFYLYPYFRRWRSQQKHQRPHAINL